MSLQGQPIIVSSEQHCYIGGKSCILKDGTEQCALPESHILSCRQSSVALIQVQLGIVAASSYSIRSETSKQHKTNDEHGHFTRKPGT